MPNPQMNSTIDEPERKFKCGLCFFTTNRKCDYIRHMLTQKHKDNCKFTEQEDRSHIIIVLVERHTNIVQDLVDTRQYVQLIYN